MYAGVTTNSSTWALKVISSSCQQSIECQYQMSGAKYECSKPDKSVFASVQSLLGDPAFPVPACLAATSTSCQEVPASTAEDDRLQDLESQSTNDRVTLQQGSFLSDWWSQVLGSSAAKFVQNRSTAHPPGLSQRLQRRQKCTLAPTRPPLFDLKAINLQLVQLVEQKTSKSLELPRYTGKAQKKEVCHHYVVRATRLAQDGRMDCHRCRPIAVSSGERSGCIVRA